MAASVREAVGLFHDERILERAIDELLALGFDRSEISLLASHETIERKLGHRYERSAELEDDSRVPRWPMSILILAPREGIDDRRPSPISAQ